MQPKYKNLSRAFAFSAALLGLNLAGMAMLPAAAMAQAAAPPAVAANRFVGTIASVSTGLLTVKTDAGAERKVTVPDGIKIQRIAPGEKDLSKAATIQFSDLAVGDRVLVRIAPDPASDPVTAILIVAIPQADVAQKQQKEREDWQRNGVGGLVKSVDAGTGVVVITSGAGPAQKTITLHTTPATVLRRYAPDSVSFDQAKPAPLEVIQVGDQLRARGTKSPDGLEVAAVEVVSGSFRNISGVISSIDKSAMTLTLKDLATKQNFTVRVGADAQMRKLPENMAKMLANLTSSASGDSKGGSDAKSGPPSGKAPEPAAPPAAADGTQRQPYPGAPGTDAAPTRRGGDMQQMLNRAPAIHLADLQKGDAIMLVSTQGTSEVTAITLLAGVEPLLQAPASTQNMLLSNWNMGSGGAEAAQ